MYIIKQGDCLEIMKELEPESFEALITDPPYSSGGLFVGTEQKQQVRNT